MKQLTRYKKYSNVDVDDVTLTEFRKVFGDKLTGDVNRVFDKAKNRLIDPDGHFDRVGRFYLNAGNRGISRSRSPSRAHPYSEMIEGRTRKFIMRAVILFDLKNEEDIIKRLF